MRHPAQIHFDSIAHKYDCYKSEYNFYYNELKNALKDHIPPGERVLDVGCGTGNLLRFIVPRQGTGIDISDQMIKIAKLKYGRDERLKFYVHNIEKAPFKRQFNYILCADVIEHLSDVERAFTHIARTMNNDTQLILSMANPAWEPILTFLEKLHFKMPEGPHRRISEKELKIILKFCKLQIITKITYLPKLTLLRLNNVGLIYVYRIHKL